MKHDETKGSPVSNLCGGAKNAYNAKALAAFSFFGVSAMTMMKILLAAAGLCVWMAAMPAQAAFKTGGSAVSVADAQEHAERVLKKRALREGRDKRHHRHRRHKRVKKAAGKSTDNNTHIDSATGYND
jgi:hypothetical protein